MSQISSAIAMDRAASAVPNRFSEMETEDFIRIIFTELTNQDPLQPNDTGALLDQLNSIRSIESDMMLTGKLEALVTENQLAAASGMIGRLIEGRTENFQRVQGFVVTAKREGDDISLELDTGWRVPIENVETIVDPRIFASAQPEEQSPAEESDDEHEEDDGGGATP